MLRANPPPPFSMLYEKEANSRDRKFNIEKGGGGSIVEIRKEICLKYSKVTKCLNNFVAHCSLGRLQRARKLLALWACACACAWSDLKCPRVRGTFSLRSNACNRIARLPRVCRTCFGRFQCARKLLALWASACTCAWSDLKCPKVQGTFIL